MKWNDLLVWIAVYAVFIFPVYLILRMWREAFGAPRMPTPHVASLIVATLSQAFLLAGLLEPTVIGPDYSPRRFTTIAINLALMLGALLVTAIVRSGKRRRLIVTCAWLACVWLYMGTISSAV